MELDQPPHPLTPAEEPVEQGESERESPPSAPCAICGVVPDAPVINFFCSETAILGLPGVTPPVQQGNILHHLQLLGIRKGCARLVFTCCLSFLTCLGRNPRELAQVFTRWMLTEVCREARLAFEQHTAVRDEMSGAPKFHGNLCKFSGLQRVK